MSRSNAETIRQIKREDQSLKLRKSILKNKHNSSDVSNELLTQLNESNDLYQQRLMKIRKFKTKSINDTKSDNIKFEWINEYTELQIASNKFEMELQSQLEEMIIDDPSSGSIKNIINELVDNQQSQFKSHHNTYEQYKEVKSMLNDTINNMKTYKLKIDGTSTNNSTNPLQHWQGPIAVFADILLEIRESNNNTWDKLIEQEDELYKDIDSYKQKISTMLKEDRIKQQDNEFSQLFQLYETDDVDIELFINEWIYKISLVDMTNEKKLKVIQTEKEIFYSENRIDLNDKNGGWTELDNNIFDKIYRRAQSEGCSRKKLIDQLKGQLPHISYEDLSKHEEWYRLVNDILKRKKDTITNYTTIRNDLINQANESIKQYRINKQQQIENEKNILKHEINRQLLHQQLNEMKLVKSEIEENELLNKKKLEELEKLKIEKIIEKNEKLRKLKIELVSMYKDKKEKQSLDEMMKQEEIDKINELKAKELINKNKPLVEKRNALFIEKEQEKKRKEFELAEKEQKRLQLLCKLAEQVPYFESIQNVSSKLDHITASVKGHEYIQVDPDELLTNHRGHIPMNGFTDNKVIRDSRFRLAAALREAGVIHSEAARNAIASFHPKPHLAIHGIFHQMS